MSNLLIIGGSGFIGSRLCRRLRDGGSEFTIFDKAPSLAFPDAVTLGDVRSLGDLRAAIPEGAVLVNLAAEHRDDVLPVSLYDDVNVGGAENICAVAAERDVRTIVFTSSVAVYGAALPGTGEDGVIAHNNHYGRTKYEAERVFRRWQAAAPGERTLVIVRPTVVFGERNRGNVYNLLRMISSGLFVMVGSGDNVTAFLVHMLAQPPGVHLYNYVDEPDLTMNELVAEVSRVLGRKPGRLRIPFAVAYPLARSLDLVGRARGRGFAISSVRIRKFCANTKFTTASGETGFAPIVPLGEALERTIRYEFVESHDDEALFYSE
jgi:nucleoside-diphosphate-sugar epimerase